MKRLETFAVIVLACLAGCSGNSTTASLPKANQVPAAGPSPSSQTSIHEFGTNDTLLGGMAIGSDGNLYASTTVAVDIFAPKKLTSTLSLRSVRPLTWPNVHALVPTGAVSAGPNGTVFALGQLSGTPPPASASIAANAVHVSSEASVFTPALAMYTIATGVWGPVNYGTPGDVYEDLTEGTDGAMWVSVNTPTPKGLAGFVFTTKAGCAVPHFLAALNSILTGPDGAIWVASDPGLNEQSPSQIYRVDPANGFVTQTVTLPAHTEVAGMTAGPDGAIWFTDAGLNQIGRLSLAGEARFYPIPTADSKPLAITTGCDGALWFTENAGNNIGRITTAGAITEFPVPTPNADLGEIVPCLDSALFFTEKHAIGELTH
ncbi:MAG: Vgb family protein [Vulcanimicrobiaceae bacterium]